MPDPVLGPVDNGDTFKVIGFQLLYNQTLMNVLHYSCSNPGATPPDRFQVCKALADAMQAVPTGIFHQLRAMQSQDLTWTSVRVQFQKEIDRTYPFWEQVYGEDGQVTEVAGVASTALSIEKRAIADPLHPREGIGRMQVAGIPVTKYTGGIFDAAYVAEFNAVTEDMSDPVTVLTDVELIPVLSKKGGALWLDSPIFQCSAKNTVRVLTRRTVGRGQ